MPCCQERPAGVRNSLRHQTAGRLNVAVRGAAQTMNQTNPSEDGLR